VNRDADIGAGINHGLIAARAGICVIRFSVAPGPYDSQRMIQVVPMRLEPLKREFAELGGTIDSRIHSGAVPVDDDDPALV
jgi:hypothetical protein